MAKGQAQAILEQQRNKQGKKSVASLPLFDLPQRLWRSLVTHAGIAPNTRWADLPKAKQQALATELLAGNYQVKGKSTFKEEFVTAGGVDLMEVDFRTMQSKRLSGLYFAGEVLDIDAVTGGFNFQAAWTTAWVMAQGLGDL